MKCQLCICIHTQLYFFLSLIFTYGTCIVCDICRPCRLYFCYSFDLFKCDIVYFDHIYYCWFYAYYNYTAARLLYVQLNVHHSLYKEVHFTTERILRPRYISLMSDSLRVSASNVITSTNGKKQWILKSMHRFDCFVCSYIYFVILVPRSCIKKWT